MDTLTIDVTFRYRKGLELCSNEARVPSATNDKLEVVFDPLVGVVPPGRSVIVRRCTDEAEKPVGTNTSAQGLHLDETYVSGESGQGIVTHEVSNLVIGVGKVPNS